MSCFVDIVRPINRRLSMTFSLGSILAGSLFIAALAQIAIPLGFTPIFLTLQTFALFLLSAVLGSRKGALAVLAYIAEGAIGFPVFSNGGSGIAYLLGVSGGYLLGYVLLVFITGYLLEKGWKEHLFTTLLALVIGEAMMLLCGSLYLGFFCGFSSAFQLGALPFLIGDLLKILTALFLIRGGWRLQRQIYLILL